MASRYWLMCLFTALLALAFSSSFACEYPVSPPFSELLTHARNVGIVRVVSSEIDPADHSDELVIARVRRIETLRGKPYEIRTVRYGNGMCGGRRLDVGQYYLLVTEDEISDFVLVPGGNGLLPLWAFNYLPPEFWAQVGRRERDSSSVMSELRLAVTGNGKLPEYETSEGLARIQTIPPPPPCVGR